MHNEQRRERTFRWPDISIDCRVAHSIGEELADLKIPPVKPHPELKTLEPYRNDIQPGTTQKAPKPEALR